MVVGPILMMSNAMFKYDLILAQAIVGIVYSIAISSQSGILRKLGFLNIN